MKKIKDFMAHLLFILAFVFVASGMLECCVIKLMELCTHSGLFDETLLENMATCAKITEALLDPRNGGKDNA